MTDDDRSTRTRLGYELGADDDTEAQDFEEVAAQLGLSVEPVVPTASLKADLFAKLASTPQLPPLADATGRPAQAHESASPEAAAPEAAAPAATAAPAPTPVPGSAAPSPGPAETRARIRWSKPIAILAAAAAAIVLFVGGAFVGSALSGGTSFQQQQASALAAINAAPDAQRASAEVAGGGKATLVWSGDLGKSALVATDLPPLPDGKTYELWYLRDNRAIPAGTMSADGPGSTWRVLSGSMHAGDAVGVTVEPKGGSEKPSSAPIVAIAS